MYAYLYKNIVYWIYHCDIHRMLRKCDIFIVCNFFKLMLLSYMIHVTELSHNSNSLKYIMIIKR